MTRLPMPRLERLAARAGGPARPLPSRPAGTADEEPEHCDLCSAPIGPGHRHLLDLEARALLCACRACSLLFDRDAAGGGHYRLVPDRVVRLDGSGIDDAAWSALRIPVDLAFFFRRSTDGRVAAFYPGPMGATESQLPIDTWAELERAHPELSGMEPDVEALLIDRTRGRNHGWLAPVDACYELVGLIRSRWQGLGGGAAVWAVLDDFLARLERRSAGPRTHAMRRS